MARTRLQKHKQQSENNTEKAAKVQVEDEQSLDQLFKDLAAETSKKSASPQTLEQIQQELQQLPKIESELDQPERKKAKRGLVVRVNDPVAHPVAKPKKGEETDSGAKWFNMQKSEVTPEIKRDLLILKNRSVLDPKRHYKKDNWEIPKFFQMGTIVEGNTEFYSSRMSKKSRGRTIAEQILKDDKAVDYFDKKYSEIQAAKNSGGKAHYKKLMAKRRGF